MLLFASEEGVGNEPFTFEWYPRGLTDLMSDRDFPEFRFTFPMLQHESVYCYLYETCDFPEAKERIRGTRFEPWKSFDYPCGSKMGGYCKSTPAGSEHIFTLESIRLIFGEPYPFVNRQNWEPDSAVGKVMSRLDRKVRELRGARNPCYDILMIGDLGRIHIFKEASGEFRVTDECY